MLDSTAVDQIVANVLRQLSAAGGPVSTVAKVPTAFAPQVSVPRINIPAHPGGSPVTLTDKIITGDLLTEKATGATKISRSELSVPIIVELK